MLYLFRQLRRRILKSSESRRYFIYAIGEIVLVVIGILIALQINNWNEKKNARQFELTMLNEVRSALLQDKDYVGSHIPFRMSYAKNGLSYFNRWLRGKSTDRDSVDYHFKRMFNSFHVTLNRGPYEALKFTGLDKVSNDSLRNQMVHVYDFVYPRYERFLVRTEESRRDRLWELYDKLRVERELVLSNDEVRIPNPGMRDIDFSQDQDFLEFLDITASRVNSSEYSVGEFVPQIDSLIVLLNHEIGNASTSQD